MCDLKMRIYGLLVFFIAHCSSSLPGAFIDDDIQIQSKRQLAGSFKSHQHEPGIPEFQPGEHVEYGLDPFLTLKPKTLQPPPEISTATELSVTTEVSQTTETTEVITEATTLSTTSIPPYIRMRPETPSLTFDAEEVGELMLITDAAFYKECGKTKTCFGFPDGCIETHKCWIAMTLWETKGYSGRAQLLDPPTVSIALAATNPSPRAYVAIGFSKDQLMGDDYVIACMHSPIGPYIAARPSYNDRNYQNIQRFPLPCNASMRPIVGYAQANGVLTCLINLQMSEFSKNCDNNIFEHANYIMLAFGKYNERAGLHFGELEGHYAAVVSANARSLTQLYKKPEIIHVNNLPFNLHVYTSILAHSFLIPAGNIMAKYGQEAFSWNIGKFPFWILAHVIMTILGVLLSVIGIASASKDMDQNRLTRTGKAHMFFGFLACAFYFISLITGICLWIERRNINYYIGKLNIVRWLHWIVGNFSVLIGSWYTTQVTIHFNDIQTFDSHKFNFVPLKFAFYLVALLFYASDMRRAFIPCIFTLLAGLLLFVHVGTVIFMSFHTYWLAFLLDSTIKLRIACIGPIVPFEPADENAEKNFPNYEAWSGRKTAVYFYIIATALIATGMICLIAGPMKLCFN